MRTDITAVDSKGSGIQTALDRTEGLADVENLSGRDRLHLRLLAEELFGAVTAIAGEFTAEYRAEGEDGEYRLILEAEVPGADEKAKEELIGLSSTGENDADRGIMAKIWSLFTAAARGGRESSVLEAARGKSYGEEEILYGKLGSSQGEEAFSWSLREYRKNVGASKEQDQASMEAWDELEKSVVANLASDVRVAVTDSRVKLTVFLTVK